MKSKTLLLEGPFCYPCIKKLIKYIRSVEGIVDAKVNVVAGLLIIYFEDSIDIMKVKAAIEKAGFNFLGIGE